MSCLEQFQKIKKNYENGIFETDDIKFLIDVVENLNSCISKMSEEKRQILDNYKKLNEENEHCKFLLSHYKILFYSKFGQDTGNHIPQIDYLDFEGMR